MTDTCLRSDFKSRTQTKGKVFHRARWSNEFSDDQSPGVSGSRSCGSSSKSRKCSGRSGSLMQWLSSNHEPRSSRRQRSEQNGFHGPSFHGPRFLHWGQITDVDSFIGQFASISHPRRRRERRTTPPLSAEVDCLSCCWRSRPGARSLESVPASRSTTQAAGAKTR